MTAMQGKSFNYLTLDVSMSQVNLYDVIFEKYNNYCFSTRQWRKLYPNGGTDR